LTSNELVREINQCNIGCEQEIQKLDASWTPETGP